MLYSRRRSKRILADNEYRTDFVDPVRPYLNDHEMRYIRSVMSPSEYEEFLKRKRALNVTLCSIFSFAAILALFLVV